MKFVRYRAILLAESPLLRPICDFAAISVGRSACRDDNFIARMNAFPVLRRRKPGIVLKPDAEVMRIGKSGLFRHLFDFMAGFLKQALGMLQS